MVTFRPAAKWLLTIALTAAPALFYGCGFAAENSSRLADREGAATRAADIELFVREGCPHCARAEAFLAELKLQRPELRIVIRDVLKDPAALERLKEIAKKHAGTSIRVPAIAVGGQLIIGFSEEANTGQLVLDSLQRSRIKTPEAGKAHSSCEPETGLSCGAATAIPARQQDVFEFTFLGRSVSLDQLGLPLFTLAMGLLEASIPVPCGC